MKTHKHYWSEIFSLVLIVLSFGIGFYFNSRFPELVPTHWNFKGEVDGYSSKMIAAFFFPCVILGIYILMTFLPRIDPRRDRYKEFASTYSIVKTSIVVFLTVLYIITGINGIGYPMRIDIIVPALIGILFIIIGSYLGSVKTNWFIGVRNPWTLSHEAVWDKTHRMSGKLFIIAGILLFIAAFMASILKVVLFILIIVAVILIPMAYSYLVYRKVKN